MTDTLRDEVEREMTVHNCHSDCSGAVACLANAVSVAVRLIEREQMFTKGAEYDAGLERARAEAAERDLGVVQSYRREENDRLLAAEKKYDTLMASWEETAAQLTAAERERNRPHACSDPLRHEDRIVEKLLAAEKELDEARRALAERGHAMNCMCWKDRAAADPGSGPDPRCAPPQRIVLEAARQD